MRTHSFPVTPIVGAAAALVILTVCVLTSGHAWWAAPHVTTAAVATALLTMLAERALAGGADPRLRSVRGFLWSPLGRVVAVPAGLPLYSGKMYVLHPSVADTSTYVWAGWWNCRTLSGDDTEFVVFHRAGCQAVATADVL